MQARKSPRGCFRWSRQALCVGAALLLLTGCNGQRAAKTAADPGLFSEDFGVGVHLGQSLEAAREAAKESDAGTVMVLTREDLVRLEADSIRSDDDDVLVALYSDEGGSGEGAVEISEIRIYLAQMEKSDRTLLGSKLAELDTEGMKQLLGEPVSSRPSPDGQNHLSWRFSADGKKGRLMDVVASFQPMGHCYAFAVRLLSPGEK